MKTATQQAADRIRNSLRTESIVRVIRQKKIISEWLEKEIVPMEKDNIAKAMKAVYIKSLLETRFDIDEFIKEYLSDDD